MSRDLSIRNRQRNHRVNLPLLRQLVGELFETEFMLDSVELGISLVGEKEMARVNWQFLQHEGSTDVITFDHTEAQDSWRRDSRVRNISGELYVCVDDALRQAKSFQTTWQAEVVRYIVHGILHLMGHDDHDPVSRRVMKREENRLVRIMARRFSFRQLGK